MKYYFEKTLDDIKFDKVISKVTSLLKNESFGILNTIDIKKTMFEKLGQELKNYKILGACNPSFAFEALQQEANIGLLLPCNIVVRELEDGKVLVAAIDPAASMGAIENDKLTEMAQSVQQKMKQLIALL